MPELNQYLECARVTSTHGVKGDVRLECMCDSPDVLAALAKMYRKDGSCYRPLYVERTFIQKNAVVAHFTGIDSIEAAIAMKNAVLYADRDDFELPKGGFFIADLIGLPVIDDETGEKYGTVSDITSPSAQQVYHVKSAKGEFLIPSVAEFIRDISLGAEHGSERSAGVYVKLIPGMMPEGRADEN